MRRPSNRGRTPRASLVPSVLGALALGASAFGAPQAPAAPQGAPDAAVDPRAPSTRRMAALLAALADSPNMDTSPFSNTTRAASLEDKLAALGEEQTPERFAVEFELACEWLKCGREEDAIAALGRLHAFAEQTPGAFPDSGRYEVASMFAIANLRLGEVENCAGHHGVDSCLLPIQGDGVHVEPRGSQGAVSALEDLLKAFPGDLRARWILNIAHMTLGTWPGGVRPEWLIPPEAFASDYPLPRFYDAAGKVGLAMFGLAGGCIVDDFDGDEDLDVMASSSGFRDQTRYFENAGDGTFADRTEAAGMLGLTGGLNLTSGDYDNDGRLDALILRGGWQVASTGLMPNSLLHNDGGDGKGPDGSVHFTDATAAAGMLSFNPTQVGAWGDFDNDGWLDLFVGNESTRPFPHPSELYHNKHDGTFNEVSEEVGLGVSTFVKGASWGDYDNDGRIDLYISCYTSKNRLYHNDGRQGDGWHFTNVAVEAGVMEPINSFPCWFFDFDNDGWQDIFVSDYDGNEGDVAADYLRPKGEGPPSRVGRPRLYKNKGDGTFTDVAAAMGLDDVLRTMGSNYGDLDNDGFLDFYLATGNPDFRLLVPNRMFRNDGGKRFQDVTTAGGFGNLQKGHGIAFSDIDNDGDQDVYAVLGGAYESDGFRNSLFENPGNANHWIALRLEGKTSNRSAIGARLRVRVRAPSGARDVRLTVGTGGSFGASSLRQTIGLGDATAIERVEIQWPATGLTQTFADLGLDRMYHVTEGSAEAVPIPTVPIHLGGAAPPPPCHTTEE